MPLRFPSDLVVSVSGFRGKIGAPLTPELITALAAAYGAFLQEEGDGDTVFVGRDSRTSGPMLSRAAVAGLISVGCQVVELGIVPTPTLLLAVEDAGVAGGLCVTASHNPAEWNALKFCVGDGTYLPPDRMERFQAYVQETDPPRATWDDLKIPTADRGSIARHHARIMALPHLDVELIRSRKMKVALDCVRGAGGAMMPALLEDLGCEVVAIGLETDGRFPRDPEPTAATLKDLADLVASSGADIGFAVDPDVDRLSLISEKGTPLGEDLTLALAADVVLNHAKGPVVTNLSTSRVVEDVASSHGVPLIRSAVGEINVASRMIAENAIVGGEGNGGVILPALHHTRDAPVGAALLLQLLASNDEPLSAIVARWPSYSIVKEKMSFPREFLAKAYEVLLEEMPSSRPDHSDGLRLQWPDKASWLHVRPSGTEPIIRLIAEAPDHTQAKDLVDSSRSFLEAVATESD